MKKRHLSEVEQAKLLHYFDGHRIDAVVLLIELEFYTGIRTDELLRLKPQSIDVENSMLHVVRASKDSEQRSITAPGHVLKALMRHCEVMALSHEDTFEKLLNSKGEFPAVKKMMHRRWRRIAFEVFGYGFTLGLHSLRHSFAARIHKITGNNVVAVQRALGHKSLKTTERYLQHIDMEAINKKLQTFNRNGVKSLKRKAS